VAVNLATRNDDAFALFSVLDLYRQAHTEAYLQLARAIGNNMVRTRFHDGYFTPAADYLFARINALEPYALLALEAAIRGTPEKVDHFINGSGFFDTEYRFADGTTRRIQDGWLFTQRKGRPLVAPPERFAPKRED
jgi:pectate lyase